MSKLGTSEAFVLFANAVVFAGLLVLPGIAAGYVLCKLRVRQACTDFSLGKLESVELDRAVLLYQGARERQEEIQRQCAQVSGTLVARYRQRRRLHRTFAEERWQLGAYAAHLRSTIIRLRRAPIGRLRSWMQVRSLYSTLGGGLVVYAAAWIALIAVYQPYHPWRNVADDLNDLLLWEPVDFHVLVGNLLASAMVLATMPDALWHPPRHAAQTPRAAGERSQRIRGGGSRRVDFAVARRRAEDGCGRAGRAKP
jgi:hypothetical protein